MSDTQIIDVMVRIKGVSSERCCGAGKKSWAGENETNKQNKAPIFRPKKNKLRKK